jgi:hypothetical protein
MNLQATAAFCIPYYGQFPTYIGLFLQSCVANPSVHFLIFTENPPHPAAQNAPNIHFIHYTYQQLIAKANQTIGIAMQLGDVHKICDLKPFYGLLFAEYLQNYAFWGYCDVDVIFGDLSKVIHPTFLQEVDIFSAQTSRIVGHFCLLRNTPTINQLPFLIPDHREKLEKVLTNTFLDEKSFTNTLRQLPNIRWQKTQDLNTELHEDFIYSHLTFNYQERISEMTTAKGTEFVHWQDGKLYFHHAKGQTEALYFHFMAMKLPIYWQKLAVNTIYHSFYLSPIGFSTDAPNWQQFNNRILKYKIKGLVRSKALAGKLLTRFFSKSTKRKITLFIKKLW